MVLKLQSAMQLVCPYLLEKEARMPPKELAAPAAPTTPFGQGIEQPSSREKGVRTQIQNMIAAGDVDGAEKMLSYNLKNDPGMQRKMRQSFPQLQQAQDRPWGGLSPANLDNTMPDPQAEQPQQAPQQAPQPNDEMPPPVDDSGYAPEPEAGAGGPPADVPPTPGAPVEEPQAEQPQPVQDADPETPGMQNPAWLAEHENATNLTQQMQGMDQYNQRNKDIDDMAKARGWSPEQTDDFRRQVHPEQQQQQQSGYDPNAGYGQGNYGPGYQGGNQQQGNQQQSNQPQQNTFWQDVGQGAASGAGMGAAGGAAAGALGGGFGALPGAAIGAGGGGLAGGLAGGAKNLYNKGKNLWNSWQQFRNQPQQTQQQPQQRYPQPQQPYASGMPQLTAYASSALFKLEDNAMTKLASEDDAFAMFIGSLDDNGRDALDYFMNNEEATEETNDFPTITAQQSSASFLIHA